MTRTGLALRVGHATDPGRLRANNEDRIHADEAAGIFLVVDGMGGHAAGEKAAETAVAVIPRLLDTESGAVETRIREAIAAANNEISALAQAQDEWFGMACVLTLAVAHDDKLTVGHVGDSRLYLAFPGGLRKLTSDHSPVGEREDRGDITEEEAMRDPRRNQVFRDVGSRPHDPSDEGFIEVKTFPFRPDAAFLLCTDGLSDVLTNAEMNAIVQRYHGDPQPVAQQLIDAANDAGGKDNISVVFVAGPEFTGTAAPVMQEARVRHSVTRLRKPRTWKSVLANLLWLTAGAVLGVAGFVSSERLLPRAAPPPPISHQILVTAADPRALAAALAAAHSGDVIEVAKGDYLGPLEWKDGVDVISLDPGQTTIYTADAATPAITLRNIVKARIAGLHIAGSPAHPLGTGLLIANSTVDIDEIEVTGARDSAIRIEGASNGAIRAGSFHDNPGRAIFADGLNSVRFIGNTIQDLPPAVAASTHAIPGKRSAK